MSTSIQSLSPHIAERLKTRTIPTAQHAKTLLNIRDKVLFPTAALPDTASLHDQLNRRLLGIMRIPSADITREVALKTANDYFRKHYPLPARGIALEMTGGEDAEATIFQRYDEQFAVVVFPKEFGDVPGTCFGRIPIIPEIVLAEAKQGEKSALMFIAHEKKHGEYFRIHGEIPLNDYERRLVSEVYAHTTAFAEIFGAGFRLMAYVDEAARQMESHIIDDISEDIPYRCALQAGFQVAMHVMIGEFISGRSKIAADYVLTASSLDQVIGMDKETKRTLALLDRTIAALRKKDPAFDPSISSELVVYIESNHEQYVKFKETYERVDSKQ